MEVHIAEGQCKDKERLVRSLRNELRKAEKALDEYRDDYERLCDKIDNKRRRRY